MAGDSRWQFTKEQVENSPSRSSGMDSEKELNYRQQAANFIQDVGQKLQVTQLCINTAIVYMHRFYMFHSFSKFHRNNIAAAALFLAAKVEEQPRKLEHVIKMAHACWNRDSQVFDTKSEAYLERAQELVMNENILLQTLGFDVSVDHPHSHVVKTCHLVRASKDLAQTSYFLATNSLHLTAMCLLQPPTVVACVCIHLACKWSDWEIPRSSEGKEWYWYTDKSVTTELLEELTSDFLVILDKCPSKLKKKIMKRSDEDFPDGHNVKIRGWESTAQEVRHGQSSHHKPHPAAAGSSKNLPPQAQGLAANKPQPHGSSSGSLRRVQTEPNIRANPQGKDHLTHEEYFKRKAKERLESQKAKESARQPDKGASGSHGQDAHHGKHDKQDRHHLDILAALKEETGGKPADGKHVKPPHSEHKLRPDQMKHRPDQQVRPNDPHRGQQRHHHEDPHHRERHKHENNHSKPHTGAHGVPRERPPGHPGPSHHPSQGVPHEHGTDRPKSDHKHRVPGQVKEGHRPRELQEPSDGQLVASRSEPSQNKGEEMLSPTRPLTKRERRMSETICGNRELRVSLEKLPNSDGNELATPSPSSKEPPKMKESPVKAVKPPHVTPILERASLDGLPERKDPLTLKVDLKKARSKTHSPRKEAKHSPHVGSKDLKMKLNLKAINAASPSSGLHKSSQEDNKMTDEYKLESSAPMKLKIKLSKDHSHGSSVSPHQSSSGHKHEHKHKHSNARHHSGSHHSSSSKKRGRSPLAGSPVKLHISTSKGQYVASPSMSSSRRNDSGDFHQRTTNGSNTDSPLAKPTVLEVNKQLQHLIRLSETQIRIAQLRGEQTAPPLPPMLPHQPPPLPNEPPPPPPPQ